MSIRPPSAVSAAVRAFVSLVSEADRAASAAMRAAVMAGDAALHREARGQRQMRELRHNGGIEEGMRGRFGGVHGGCARTMVRPPGGRQARPCTAKNSVFIRGALWFNCASLS